MQDRQSDLDYSRRLGVDEQPIKFRPSPNFKNMRKFLKYKKDLESANQSPQTASSDEATPNTGAEGSPNQEKFPRDLIKQQTPERENIQPPLPLDPPPPYAPALIPIPLKQEVIDDEYPESGQESPDLSAASTEPSQPELNSVVVEQPKKTEICRDFNWRTCIRGANCRFIHKFDPSLIYRPHTFCKNFQNVGCTYPYCRYIHGTVFQQEEYYRTGVLPPHISNNMTNINNNINNNSPYFLMPPPPPPPPLPVPEVGPKLQNANVMSPLQTQPYVTVPKMEAKPAEGFGMQMKAISLKSELNGNLFSVPPRDLDNKENLAKKCKNCETMDIRLQYNKDKIDGMIRSSEELKRKSTLLNKKTDALFTVLLTVLKTQAATIEGMNGLMTTLNNCGEKEKALIRAVLQSHRGGSNMM